MDIVLEVFDTFLFDRLYSAFAPASVTEYLPQLIKHNVTATISSMREVGTFAPQSDYSYIPASAYLSLTPSKYAYMSAMPRDSIYRQAISLGLITW